MIEVKNIIVLLMLLFSIISCGEEKVDSEISFDDETFNRSNDFNSIDSDQNEIPFKGGIIHLAQENQADKNYTVQEITKQKSDIKFRAKRIPTELYLLNKGVLEEELVDALMNVEGEQLFYFEFEQEMKQDLIKKYLESDLDANISYLSFDIYEDFLLVNSQGDTMQSNYSLYERNFHVAPYERILLSFSGIHQNEEVQLIYNDKLFGRGQLDFAFASNAFVENNIKNPS